MRLSQTLLDVGPVMDGRDRPQDRGRHVGQGERFGCSLGPGDESAVAGERPAERQHDRSGIDAGDACTAPLRLSHERTGTAADVDDVILLGDVREVGGQPGDAATPPHHGEADEQAGRAGEGGVACVVVGDGCLVRVRHGRASWPVELQDD